MVEVSRIARLDCGLCGRTERVRIAIDQSTGDETFPDCSRCGPTTWIAFPCINVAAIEGEEAVAKAISDQVFAGADDETTPEPSLEALQSFYCRMATAFGVPLCDEPGCGICNMRRRFA